MARGDQTYTKNIYMVQGDQYNNKKALYTLTLTQRREKRIGDTVAVFTASLTKQSGDTLSFTGSDYNGYEFLIAYDVKYTDQWGYEQQPPLHTLFNGNSFSNAYHQWSGITVDSSVGYGNGWATIHHTKIYFYGGPTYISSSSYDSALNNLSHTVSFDIAYMDTPVSNTAPTGSIIMPQTLEPNASYDITWTSSDQEGDPVKTLLLNRYTKTPEESSYTKKAVIGQTYYEGSSTYGYNASSSKTSSTLNTADYPVGTSIYYELILCDELNLHSSKITSEVKQIGSACNTKVISDGIIISASSISTIQNGVITPMSGSLHPIVSGVIT